MKRLIKKTKRELRQVRHSRIRAHLAGTAQVPRLSVFRGLRTINLQLIDDIKGVTICSANSREIKDVSVEGKTGKVARAYETGKLFAERAKAKKITKIIFDRGGYRYHGRVAAVAQGARDNGLEF